MEYDKYDEEKKLYYKGDYAVLDVTDEEYEEICKYFPPNQPSQSETGKRYSALRSIVTIYYVFACIIGLITIFTALICGASEYVSGWMVLSILVGGALIVLMLLERAGFINVVMDIEENTRKTSIKK